jgi:hypothetical protein
MAPGQGAAFSLMCVIVVMRVSLTMSVTVIVAVGVAVTAGVIVAMMRMLDAGLVIVPAMDGGFARVAEAI